MGAGVLALLLGVVVLAVTMRKPYVPADPERTVLWLYGDVPDVAIVIEESRSAAALTAVAFPAAIIDFDTNKSPHRAQEALSKHLGRKLHHRVFLPTGVIITLIDAAGGLSVEGKAMSGTEAVAYVKAGGAETARRAAMVMLGLADAAATRGVNMGVSEGLQLAREIDTSLDLMAIPDVLGRWSSYAAPTVAAPSATDPVTLQQFLKPDPAEDGKG